MLSKHSFVIEKLSFIGFTSTYFAQTIIHDFKNIVLNSKRNFLRQMPQKQAQEMDIPIPVPFSLTQFLSKIDIQWKQTFFRQSFLKFGAYENK